MWADQELLTCSLLNVLFNNLWLQHLLEGDLLAVLASEGSGDFLSHSRAHLAKSFHADAANHRC